MNLQTLLKTKVLGADPESQLKHFLHAHLPRFVAPTNVPAWKREVSRLRREALDKVYLRGIPKAIVNAKPKVVWGEVLRPDKSYVIRKLRYEVYPDYWVPGLLYEPAGLRGKAPVVLNPNGHHRGGKAADYKQIRCANLARRGLIALNMEFIGMGDLEADANHDNIAHLELTGMAGVGLFYLALQKGLDVLLAHRHADRKRVAVTGLSGGGWQTIVISALDPRVTLSVPVAGYTPIRARAGCHADVGDKEQTPADLCTVFDYDTMTAMLAPRPALLILNHNDDCCFQTGRTRPLIYDAVRPTYEAMGAGDNFATHDNLNPGTHNYGRDNRSQLYKFIKKHFKLAADAPEDDIHRSDEILPEDRLRVTLPPEQTTMLRIARGRAIPLAAALPMPKTAAQRQTLRRRLRQVIVLPEYPARARAVKRIRGATQFILRTGPWSLPVAREDGRAGEPPVIVLNDAGRSVPMPLPIPEKGPRYLVEALGTGELAFRPINLAMIEAIGHRLLGIQVAQLLAATRWALRQEKARKAHLVADGWNASFVAIVAAAIEPKLFESCTPYLVVTRLLHLMDWPMKHSEAASLLCPGLLEVADVPQIRALMEGVEFRQPGRGVVPDRR